MPYTSLQVVTADMLNAHAFMRQATLQAIANTTWTEITLDTEDTDPLGGHSTGSNTNRYTAQIAGWYHVVGRVGFSGSSSAGYRGARIQKNGSLANGSGVFIPAVNGNVSVVPTFCDVHLAVGDWVAIAGWQTSGASLNTADSSTPDAESSMSVRLLYPD